MRLPVSTLAIFCKVVDNYGDIGICWRLARQLWREHGVRVTLWVDDLRSFRRICPEVDVAAATQQVEEVVVRHWAGQEGSFVPEDVADVVVEFFAVELPPGYVAAMAQRYPRPVWFNLEGLTAEQWVEGCHRLPSMHPRLKLTKHFFFPGFTAQTGGLLIEAGLDQERRAFQADPAAMAACLASFGVSPGEMDALKVSLFCYPHAPVAALLQAWSHGKQPVSCLVPEGVASDAIQTFLGAEPLAGRSATRGALTLRVLPFVAQPQYDRLLWACDLNVVRGEDSFVRAQWAGRPFIWHIYPQDENLHHKKLRAFLARYLAGSAGELDAWEAFSLGWNGAAAIASMPSAWQELQAALPRIAVRAEQWRREILAHGDLTTNLLEFARRLRLEAENPV
jgi:uncharacterized repeat protein (TIGR03837 family)